MHQQDAESIAISALNHIAEDREALMRFLDHTGLAPETLREVAGESAFLAAVLDYVTGDQERISAFAAAAGLTLARVDSARRALSGPDWERETA